MEKPSKLQCIRVSLLSGTGAGLILWGLVVWDEWELTHPRNMGTIMMPTVGRAAEEQPPITDFESVAANDVTDQVRDDETVIGVALNGEAKAYPLNMLTGPEREIINDHVGGRAIAVTW